jgi:hypothetical protein
LTQLTFQITHATDADTNAERDFIIAELRNNRVIGEVSEIQAGQHIEHVNHYVTDGEIALANLTAPHEMVRAEVNARASGLS